MEVLQRTANRGSISTGYDIDNSCKFEPDNSESLTKAAATGGDRKKATLSLWCKRTELTGSQASILFLTGVNGNKYTTLAWGTNDEINFHYYNSGSYPYNFLTDREFRDTAAWYHIVVAIDTAQGTAANRVKFYVNGVQETSFSTEVYPDQNIDTPFNNDSATYPMEIGNDSIFDMGGDALAGYLADYYLIDGSQLAPTEFGEFDEDSGIWIPKAYTGSYGDNGFFLDFADSGDLGDDESGNGNDFTEVNIAAADQATDTPTNNFCTLNPIFTNSGSANYQTINEGATKFVNAGNAYRLAVASMGFTSGKWYWEVKATSVSALMYMGITYPSVWDTDYTLGGTIFLDDNNDPVRYNASGRSAFGSAFGNGDIIAFALDMDASTPTMTVYKNNSSLGNLMSGLSIGGTGTAYLPPKEDGYFPKVGGYGAGTFECNFGGYTSGTPSSGASDANGYGTFEHAPPTGYYALCTKNLAEFG